MLEIQQTLSQETSERVSRQPRFNDFSKALNLFLERFQQLGDERLPPQHLMWFLSPWLTEFIITDRSLHPHLVFDTLLARVEATLKMFDSD